MLEKEELKPIIEALIFAADTALSLDKIANILEGEERAGIKAALAELMEDYAKGGGGFSIEEVAGGYQFRTNPEYALWLRRLFKIGLQKISKAAMEALAIVAYKQPVMRGEIEAIRGVDSGGVLATLMDKRFIRVVGRKELPGRPVVYGTTKEFLETFDLKDLSCLPSLKDIQKMEEENAAQEPLPEEQSAAGNTEQGRAGPVEAGGEEGGTEGEGGPSFEELEEACLEDDGNAPEASTTQAPGGDAGDGPEAEEGDDGEGCEDDAPKASTTQAPGGDAGDAPEAEEDGDAEGCEDDDGPDDGDEETGDPGENGPAEEDDGPQGSSDTGEERPGEASEDNSPGGDNVEEEG